MSVWPDMTAFFELTNTYYDQLSQTVGIDMRYWSFYDGDSTTNHCTWLRGVPGVWRAQNIVADAYKRIARRLNVWTWMVLRNDLPNCPDDQCKREVAAEAAAYVALVITAQKKHYIPDWVGPFWPITLAQLQQFPKAFPPSTIDRFKGPDAAQDFVAYNQDIGLAWMNYQLQRDASIARAKSRVPATAQFRVNTGPTLQSTVNPGLVATIRQVSARQVSARQVSAQIPAPATDSKAKTIALVTVAGCAIGGLYLWRTKGTRMRANTARKRTTR
jgi:hypothetical protein